MTLLIAEDNERIRGMLKSLVGSYFSDIYECSDGQKAIEMYSVNKPDWTLMDIDMPIMDGIAATRKITQTNPGAKVIIVTNHDSKVLRRNAVEAGALNYVLKENSSEILDLLKL